jgi:uncharacterized membrane protein
MFNDFDRTLDEYWRMLSSTFWFVPALVSLIGPLLAFFCLQLDDYFRPLREVFVFEGGIAEAVTILSTIAGSLITVAGLAFSITIVVLQLVSSQYTPRALRGFLQDRVTQVVAGGFFAIFAYSIIVLSTLRDVTNHTSLPILSITVAIALGFVGLALLLIFIHHTGYIIQVSDIAARLAEQTFLAIERPYPGWNDEPFREKETARLIQTWQTGEVSARILGARVGFVQRIELPHLVRSRVFAGLRLRLLVCPGDFVTEETVIAEVWPAHAANAVRRTALRKNIVIQRERDIMQDALFGVRQLADIALRALSPAINDPTTGVLCIKYLQAIFEHLIYHLPLASAYRFSGSSGSLEVRQPTFLEYLEVFPEIAHYAGGNMRIIDALLMALASITEIATRLEKQEYYDLLSTMTATLEALRP